MFWAKGGWVKQGKGSWSCDSTFCETQRTHPPRKPRWSLEPLCHSLVALQTRKPWFVLGLGGAPGTVWALALRRGGGGYGVSRGSQLSLCHLLVTLRSSTLSSKTSFQRQPPQRALMRAAAPPPLHFHSLCHYFSLGPSCNDSERPELLSKGNSESRVSLGCSHFVTFWCPGRLCGVSTAPLLKKASVSSLSAAWVIWGLEKESELVPGSFWTRVGTTSCREKWTCPWWFCESFCLVGHGEVPKATSLGLLPSHPARHWEN